MYLKETFLTELSLCTTPCWSSRCHLWVSYSKGRSLHRYARLTRGASWIEQEHERRAINIPPTTRRKQPPAADICYTALFSNFAAVASSLSVLLCVLMLLLLVAHSLSFFFLMAALVWPAELYLSLIPLGKTNSSVAQTNIELITG